jgi:beta-phosphoglucomutase-like phosphatase (HAD superfamily)
MNPAVIFDMDGTLCNVAPIRHHVKGGRGKKKDFAAFHSESVNCEPIPRVAEAARIASRSGLTVIVVTARMVMWARHTAMWLALHDIPSDVMFMRRNGDHRPDFEVKRDILARIQTEFKVIHAFDDNPKIIALWMEHGIPTTIVEGWEE